ECDRCLREYRTFCGINLFLEGESGDKRGSTHDFQNDSGGLFRIRIAFAEATPVRCSRNRAIKYRRRESGLSSLGQRELLTKLKNAPYVIPSLECFRDEGPHNS